MDEEKRFEKDITREIMLLRNEFTRLFRDFNNNLQHVPIEVHKKIRDQLNEIALELKQVIEEWESNK